MAEKRYDYDRQCWVEAVGDSGFMVLPCGHPESMKPTCCYAGMNPGEWIPKGHDGEPQVRHETWLKNCDAAFEKRAKEENARDKVED
jgi:hypothetical protein